MSTTSAPFGFAHSLAAAAELIAARTPMWNRLPRRVPSGSDAVNPIRPGAHVRGGTSPVDVEHAPETRASLASALRAFLNRLAEDRPMPRQPLDEIVDALIDLASRHGDSLPAIAFTRTAAPASPLHEHAVATAALTVASAVESGWSRADVRDAALVALLADAGHHLLPFDPFKLPRPLTEVEQSRLRAHPDISALLASRIDALAERTILAISQHHERPDGRGTPRAVKAPHIHDLVLLVGVCDVAAAIAAPRAHRPALAPHAALTETARLARDGTLDTDATNALIRACGAYPPGACVRLSTGDIAVVIARPSKADAARPVVRVMPDLGAASFAALGKPVTVDLADDELAAVSVVAEVEPF